MTAFSLFIIIYSENHLAVCGQLSSKFNFCPYNGAFCPSENIFPPNAHRALAI